MAASVSPFFDVMYGQWVARTLHSSGQSQSGRLQKVTLWQIEIT